MRYRILALIAILVLTAGCCAADSGPTVLITAGNEWTWETEGYNTFDGEIDLTAYAGQEVTLCMSTDLAYDASEQESAPVFTIVNGKRIKMKKQTNSVTVTPEADNGVTSFSGRMNLPKNESVRRIVFRFSVRNTDGGELASCSFELGSGDETGSGPDVFRIPCDITIFTLIFGIAAVPVWACVLIRNRKRKKKRNTGDSIHEDLQQSVTKERNIHTDP